MPAFVDKKNIIVAIWDVGTRYMIIIAAAGANEDLYCRAFYFYCRKYTRTLVAEHGSTLTRGFGNNIGISCIEDRRKVKGEN